MFFLPTKNTREEIMTTSLTFSDPNNKAAVSTAARY